MPEVRENFGAGGSFSVHRQGVARSRKAGAGKKEVRGDFGARVGRRRFFHRQGVAQIEAGKLKAQIEAPALGVAIHDAPKGGGYIDAPALGLDPNINPLKFDL